MLYPTNCFKAMRKQKMYSHLLISKQTMPLKDILLHVELHYSVKAIFKNSLLH